MLSQEREVLKERLHKAWKYGIAHPEEMFLKCLKIKDKNDNIIPFALNKAQTKVMEVIHRQLETTGKIRLAIIKSRQQGITTLCHAIMMWRMMARQYSNVLLMANDQRALVQTHFKEFLKMVEYFGSHMHCPIKNPTVKSFDFFLSQAFGRWANTKSGTRGDRFTSVHLTEVDYYDDFDKCKQTVFQCVPNTEGTCIIIESTSSGLDGNLHRFYKSNSGFEFLFLPWYDQDEYVLPSDCPPSLTEEQKRIQAQYNLTDAQMNWYRQKEEELGSHLRMQHEYPCCIEDCFAFSDDDTYVFDFLLIEKAAQTFPIANRDRRLILGIDPARKNDNIAMVWRRGQNVERIVCFAPPKSTDTRTADDLIWERVTREIRACYPDEIYVDVGGIGGNVPYILRSFGIETYINEVYFNQSPENKNAYHDKRAEMYAYAKAWLKRGASIPNNEDFIKELRMIKYNPNSPKFRLVEKDEIKKNLKHSPDIADAFALTFPYEEDMSSYSEPMHYVATTGLEDKIY
jgi:hypothetical protein